MTSKIQNESYSIIQQGTKIIEDNNHIKLEELLNSYLGAIPKTWVFSKFLNYCYFNYFFNISFYFYKADIFLHLLNYSITKNSEISSVFLNHPFFTLAIKSSIKDEHSLKRINDKIINFQDINGKQFSIYLQTSLDDVFYLFCQKLNNLFIQKINEIDHNHVRKLFLTNFSKILYNFDSDVFYKLLKIPTINSLLSNLSPRELSCIYIDLIINENQNYLQYFYENKIKIKNKNYIIQSFYKEFQIKTIYFACINKFNNEDKYFQLLFEFLYQHLIFEDLKQFFTYNTHISSNFQNQLKSYFNNKQLFYKLESNISNNKNEKNIVSKI